MMVRKRQGEHEAADGEKQRHPKVTLNQSIEWKSCRKTIGLPGAELSYTDNAQHVIEHHAANREETQPIYFWNKSS